VVLMSSTTLSKCSLPLLLAAAGVFPACAASLSVVYNLTVQNPFANGLLEGSPGLFYSRSGNDTIFTVTTKGTSATLVGFPTPPYGINGDPGALAANGLLYSTLVNASTSALSANVFSVSSTAGSEKFYAKQGLDADLVGNLPSGELFALAQGFTGGVPPVLATVDLKGAVTSFYQFSATDRPGIPIYSGDGNYYGVAGQAISGATSYFYRVTPSGTFTNVASLPFLSGGGFYGDGFVLQGTDGNFYGIQQTGAGCAGGNQHGAVYKLTPSGQFTILHDFGVCSKGVVNPLIEGSDGKLYGSRQDTNEIFSLTTSGTYSVVASLSGTYGLCPCILLQGSDGKIYGGSTGGGSTGYGTVFALDAGLPIPKPRAPAFYPKSGAAGTQVRIWGSNLFGASVQFNGVAATNVHNSGPNYIWATVPTGATTGPITITTPGGTVTTKVSFLVQ